MRPEFLGEEIATTIHNLKEKVQREKCKGKHNRNGNTSGQALLAPVIFRILLM
jgi:hypothetical protein